MDIRYEDIYLIERYILDRKIDILDRRKIDILNRRKIDIR